VEFRDPTAAVRLFILVGLAAVAAYGIAILLWPFLPALTTAIALAVLVRPVFRRLDAHTAHKGLAAFLGTAFAFFVVLIPITAISILLANEVGTGIDALANRLARALAQGGTVQQLFSGLVARLGLEDVDVQTVIRQQLGQIGSGLAGRTLGFLSGVGGWLLQGAVALFTLYYLLRDSTFMIEGVQKLIPLDAARTASMIERAREVIDATIYGNVVVAIVQGAIGGVAFWLLGLQGAAVWGTLMGLFSLLPAVGAWVVWLPATIMLFAAGEIVRGIILAVLGFLVISTIDNVLRTLLVSNRAQLHPLSAFFSVLGGIFVFGAAGVFVGPVVFVIGLTVIETASAAVQRPAALGPAAPGAESTAGT